jgi:ABC-type amino acid transport substrate-binding protein
MRRGKALFITVVAAAVCLLLYFYVLKETPPPKVYTIGVDETWYPLQLYNKEQAITEFSKGLLEAIGAQENFSFRLTPTAYEQLFTGLDSGDYDAILASLSGVEESGENYLASDPYYFLGPVLVVPASSDIKSIKDLNNKYIGIIRDSIPITPLFKSGFIDIVPYGYVNLSNLIHDVLNQQMDGAILDAMTAYEITKSGIYSGQLKIVSQPLTQEGLRLIGKRDLESQALIKKFDEGLSALKKEGGYKKLLLKWDLYGPENQQEVK